MELLEVAMCDVKSVLTWMGARSGMGMELRGLGMKLDKWYWPILTVVIVIDVIVSLLSIPNPEKRVVDQSQPKVVKITVVVSEKTAYVGSGALISHDGLILTCAHLFGHDGKVFVKTMSGQDYMARIVRVDHAVDLAVIKIDPVKRLPYFTFGTHPYIGEHVIAFGSPLAIQGVATFGYIEQLNLDTQRYTLQGCPTNAGNSGGPLVDLRGRLIGVNTAVLLLNPFQIAQGLGLAVNLDTIQRFVRA